MGVKEIDAGAGLIYGDVNYIEAVTTILMAILGWLFGMLTPGIVERIRRPYRRKELTEAIVDEMHSLEFVMALMAYAIRARYADVSDAFMDEILPVLESYNGSDRDEKTVEAMKRLRALPEAERKKSYQGSRKSNEGIGLKQYGMPLLVSQTADLPICSLDFQRAILRIRYQLDLFNQLVPYAQSLFEKTYNNPREQDRQALIANQEQAYQDAGKRAEIIVRGIGKLRKEHGRA